MALADHEQRELDEIEQRLSLEDPRLAATLTRPSALASVSSRALRALGVFATYLCGLLAVMAGVTWSSVPLTAFGALLCTSVFAGLFVHAWRKRRD